MAFIGKLLVLLYGAGSLMCLMWAVTVYTQKMDFVTPKAETGKESAKKAVSRVEVAQALTKELQTADNRAYTRWRQEYDDLLPVEIDQSNRREFYRGQIELTKNPELALQELGAPDPVSGLLSIDKPTGRKAIEVRAMVELKPAPFYQGKLKAINEEMIRVLGSIKTLIAEHADATKIINGTAEPLAKGLRVRIREQEDISVKAIDEKLFLEDYVTNRGAEAQKFAKRRDAMQARIEELKKYFKTKAEQGGSGN